MHNSNKLEEPSVPVRLLLRVPGRTFDEKKKNALLLSNIILIACAAIVFFFMFNFPLKSKFSCVYKVDSYDCSAHSASFFRNLDANNLKDVMKAIIATQDGMYQMQFVNLNNEKLSYTGLWDSSRSDIEKQTFEVNKLINRNKDFNYSTKMEMIPLLGMLFCLGMGGVMFFASRHFLNNYAYEEVYSNKYGHNAYQAVLKGKNIGKLRESEVTALTSGMFGHSKERENEILDLDGHKKVDNAPVREYKEPKLTDEQLANLQDDELTDVQKEFYDRNN